MAIIITDPINGDTAFHKGYITYTTTEVLYGFRYFVDDINVHQGSCSIGHSILENVGFSYDIYTGYFEVGSTHTVYMAGYTQTGCTGSYVVSNSVTFTIGSGLSFSTIEPPEGYQFEEPSDVTLLRIAVSGAVNWPVGVDTASSYYIVNGNSYALSPYGIDTWVSPNRVGKLRGVPNQYTWFYPQSGETYNWHFVIIYTPPYSPYTFTIITDTHSFSVAPAVSLPEKPINPTPAHESTKIDFSAMTLSWEDGGGANSYDVYFGVDGNMVSLGNTSNTSIVVPYTTETVEEVVHAYVDGTEVDWNVPFYWRVDSVNEVGTTTGDIWNFDARPVKSINPAPETEEKDVDRKTENLEWEDGADNAKTFNVNFGTESGNLTEVMTEVPVILPELLAPYVVLEIKDYDPHELSGYRSPIVGDELTDGTTTYTLWAVQRGERVNTQYEAKLYAFRIGPPCSAGTVLTNGVEPDINDPQAVSVTLNDSTFFSGEVESALYPWATRYYWRIDAVNKAGTTTGDEWYFDVQRSYKDERMNYYDPDLKWSYTDGQYQWSEVYVAGGGRYDLKFVAVGHNCIYFGSI